MTVTVTDRLPESPSTTVASPTDAAGTVGVSSSMMVTIAMPSSIVTGPETLDSCTLKLSSPSTVVSPLICTVIVLENSPGANTTKPDATTKSTPACAVPGPVAHVTVMSSDGGLAGSVGTSSIVSVTSVVPPSPSVTNASPIETRAPFGSYSSKPGSSVRTLTLSKDPSPVVSTPKPPSTSGLL